jgi:hypothetical protein
MSVKQSFPITFVDDSEVSSLNVSLCKLIGDDTKTTSDCSSLDDSNGSEDSVSDEYEYDSDDESESTTGTTTSTTGTETESETEADGVQTGVRPTSRKKRKSKNKVSRLCVFAI